MRPPLAQTIDEFDIQLIKCAKLVSVYGWFMHHFDLPFALDFRSLAHWPSTSRAPNQTSNSMLQPRTVLISTAFAYVLASPRGALNVISNAVPWIAL